MYLRIEQIKEEGLALEFEEKPEVFPVLSEMINQGECNFIAPIKTALRAIRIDDMIEVKGNINTLVRLPCGRCLKEYETPLKSRFDLTYVHRIPGFQEDEEQDEVEISAAEMGLIYFEGEAHQSAGWDSGAGHHGVAGQGALQRKLQRTLRQLRQGFERR